MDWLARKMTILRVTTMRLSRRSIIHCRKRSSTALYPPPCGFVLACHPPPQHVTVSLGGGGGGSTVSPPQKCSKTLRKFFFGAFGAQYFLCFWDQVAVSRGGGRGRLQGGRLQGGEGHALSVPQAHV